MSELEPDYGRRMTNAEAVLLCRFAKAACPQQAFDAFTPDAWGELLGDLRFQDCKEALTDVVKRQPFVAPAEIRDEVRRVRSKRIGDFGPIEVPSGLSPRDYSEYMAESLRRIGDGEAKTTADLPDLPVGAMEIRNMSELGQAGSPVPRRDNGRLAQARAAAELARAEHQAAQPAPLPPLLEDGDLSREGVAP